MIESEHCANWHFKYNTLFCRDNFNKKYLVRKKNWKICCDGSGFHMKKLFNSS